jgi:hypothetical protein
MKNLNPMPELNIDGLEKSRKNELFTSVFCIWYLVFSILTYRYRIIYFIPKHQTRNTKHLMNSTFYEFINIEDLWYRFALSFLLKSIVRPCR